jgi:hypothetical protein
MRGCCGAQQQHMTVLTNSHASTGQPPFGHGARYSRSSAFPACTCLSKCSTAMASCHLPARCSPSLVPRPGTAPLSSSHNKTRTRDAPPISTRRLPLASLRPLFPQVTPLPQFPPAPAFTLSSSPTFSRTSDLQFPPGFPAASTSPRTAVAQFPPPGFVLFPSTTFSRTRLQPTGCLY